MQFNFLLYTLFFFRNSPDLSNAVVPEYAVEVPVCQELSAVAERTSSLIVAVDYWRWRDEETQHRDYAAPFADNLFPSPHSIPIHLKPTPVTNRTRTKGCAGE